MRLNEKIKIVSNNVILIPYEKHHVLKYHAWMQSEELQELTASEPLTVQQEYEMQKTWREDEDKCTFIILDKHVFEKTNDEIESMIGDTNLFLDCENSSKAEIEIMIAETKARGKGYGLESIALMLLYGIEKLSMCTYQAKISLKNDRSIKLFKNIGFQEISTSAVFDEVTLEMTVDDEWVTFLKQKSNAILKIDNYCVPEISNKQLL